MICRIKRKPDGSLYAEGFNPRSREWDMKVYVASLMFSGQLTAKEAQARVPKLLPSES